MAESPRSTKFSDQETFQLLKEESDYHPPTQARSKFITVARTYIIVIHIALGVLLFRVWGKPDNSVHKNFAVNGESWSPAREFFEYEIQSEHSDHSKHSKYSGTPTRAQDTAWDELIRPMFFNASLEELQRGGETIKNLAVVEGGGYAATIGAYHELHVLQLRFYVFESRYYPNLTTAQRNYLHGHLDHCIETLRITIMCYGNPGLVSFAWGGDDATKPLTQSNSRSMCVNWDSVAAWAHSRAPTNYALAEDQPAFNASGQNTAEE
ncbi:hypothetical protein F4777DRAFT_595889 [Nemania sp. FL0916]|nr:hypothetical protein F4777DRAFT_595889 [Nemania sp. FL0916]